MGSLFDSEVYALRKSIPFARPDDLERILEQIGYDGDYHLECWYRHSNKTRQQWTLDFEVDGDKYHVRSERLDLLLWRLVTVYRRCERRREMKSRMESISRPDYEI